MKSIIKISELNTLEEDKLTIIDDENNGICLGLKSDNKYTSVDFKYKELKYKDTFFGNFLVKLDNSFYNCIAELNDNNKLVIQKLLGLNSFNLIVFGSKQESKVYRIYNNISNNLLFNISDFKSDKKATNELNTVEEINKLFPAKLLWNK